MHTAHPIPRDWTDWLDEATIVCRCEEVTYQQICAVRDDLGAHDLRTVKMLARPGMGWCQGAVCGAATARIAAEHERRDLTAEDLRSGAKRPICVPVDLRTLAGQPTPAGPGTGPT